MSLLLTSFYLELGSHQVTVDNVSVTLTAIKSNSVSDTLSHTDNHYH